MNITYTQNDITGRVSQLTLTPHDAGEELFLSVIRDLFEDDLSQGAICVGCHGDHRHPLCRVWTKVLPKQ